MKTLITLLNTFQNFVFRTTTFLQSRVVKYILSRAYSEQGRRKGINGFRNLAKPACQGHAGRAKKENFRVILIRPSIHALILHKKTAMTVFVLPA